MATILEVDQNFPQPGIVEHAIELIKDSSGVLVYPTDTIYGLGCDINDKKAISIISEIKNRPSSKQYSILVDSLEMLIKYSKVNSSIKKLLSKYLPGPFTFILKASSKVPKNLIAPDGTIAIRIPNNRLCWALVKELKSPIITTSLNISTKEVITNPNNIPSEMLNKITVILDAGDLNNISSTIVNLTVKPYQVVREGKGVFKD